MEKAKQIIAHFINKNPKEINDDTIMDYNSVTSSIMLVRMYSALAENDFIVNDVSQISTFYDFKKNLKNNNILKNSEDFIDKKKQTNISNENPLLIGVDIENVENIISNDNLNSKVFLSNNFTDHEIAYCKEKNNPANSFAGLFSLKESIVKADNSFLNIPFSEIEIKHDKNNKPYFMDFFLSISHSNNYVFTIAIKLSDTLMKKTGLTKYLIEKNILKNLKI